jgi:hypothetical protein
LQIMSEASTQDTRPRSPSPGRVEAIAERAAWAQQLPPDVPGSRVTRVPGTYALNVQCTRRNSTDWSCKRRLPSLFAPEGSKVKEKAYLEAVDAIGAAWTAKDVAAWTTARDTIASLATAKCMPCREGHKKARANPTTVIGQCVAEWERLKREVFHTCCKCGAKRSMQANHLKYYADHKKAYDKLIDDGVALEEAERRIPKSERKLHQLSDTHQWARPANGGVEGMRAEAPKCEPLCSMCHALDDESSTANCNRADPAKVKEEDYATRKQFTDARNKARRKMEKRNYVNRLKRRIGGCERPDCPSIDGPARVGACVAGFEQCYDWDHWVEATKGRGLSRICNDGHSLEHAKPEIHAELGLPLDFDIDTDPIPPAAQRRCRLLCRNCHVTRKKTWDLGVDAHKAVTRKRKAAAAGSSAMHAMDSDSE